MPAPSSLITELLLAHGAGDAEAFDRLLPIIYEDLRALAHRELRRAPAAPTLNTTSLVHEAYLKLVDQTRASWKDRGHFLAVAARAMRHILVDHARQRSAKKRGGGQRALTLDENCAAVEQQVEEILAVDQALDRLATIDERLVHVVECRYFVGLTEAETALAVGISEPTVQRDWRRARAMLRELIERP